nr:hypothetical protein CFP56_27973 [Quercus suber]
MSFGVGIIRDVLKGRPKLHTVKLLSCTGVCNIISEGLNTLIVIEHMIALPKLEILATKLESLHIEGSVNFVGKIQIKDVSTLVKARLIVSNIIPITNNNLMEVMDDQVQLLTSVNHAEDITIRGWCVKKVVLTGPRSVDQDEDFVKVASKWEEFESFDRVAFHKNLFRSALWLSSNFSATLMSRNLLSTSAHGE